jgi:hypothetical protein
VVPAGVFVDGASPSASAAGAKTPAAVNIPMVIAAIRIALGLRSSAIGLHVISTPHVVFRRPSAGIGANAALADDQRTHSFRRVDVWNEVVRLRRDGWDS